MLASSITSASTFSALSSQSRPGLPDAVGPSAEGLWVCAAYRQQAPAPKGAALLKRQLFEHRQDSFFTIFSCVLASFSTYLNSVNDECNQACVMQTAAERALLTATDTGGNAAYSTRWGLHWKYCCALLPQPATEQCNLKRCLQTDTFPKHTHHRNVFAPQIHAAWPFPLKPLLLPSLSLSHKPFLTFNLVPVWASLRERKQGFEIPSNNNKEENGNQALQVLLLFTVETVT